MRPFIPTAFQALRAFAVRLALGCLFLCAPEVVRAGNSSFAFWVWNRSGPLTSDERDSLAAAGVDSLYWQMGELELHQGELALRQTSVLPPPEQDQTKATLRVIPVVRVSTSIHSPEQFSGEALGRALRAVVNASPDREVQIDFDCPDRLLPVYAEHLRVARQNANIQRLTITALAGWARAPAAAVLWEAVDAIYPMLYDTEADPAPVPNDLVPCRPRRLLDPDRLRTQLHDWSRCPIPWYAGLPVFARVTLYDPTGQSRGHLRAWDWEDLIFNSALTLDRPPAGGTTILRALRPSRIGANPLPAGGYAAMRTAELAAIRAGAEQARAAGAKGVVFFRLPDPPSPLGPTGSGWSLPQALTLGPTAAAAGSEPLLTIRRAADGSDRWTLRNDSELDLPPRLDAAGRGYGLELELAGGAPGWREALPGDFHNVTGHVFAASAGEAAPSEGKPVPVVVPLARRLTFWFAGLPAHGSLTTGLIQLAPGVDPAALRFRVPLIRSPLSTWQRPD